MRLAFVSSIPCAPTCGGPLTFHRHFVERKDFDFFDFSEGTIPIWEQWLGARWANSRAFKRIQNTRLHPYLLAAAHGTRLGHSARKLIPKVAAVRPDAIVTVAYGRRAFVAQRIAQTMRLPLITFLHDWWPDLLYSLTPATRRWLDKKMRSLARASNLILSVTPELIAELEPHPNAVILLPIPASPTAPLKSDQGRVSGGNEIPLLVYVGALGGDYGEMILDLGNALMAIPGPKWRLKAFGRIDEGRKKEFKKLADAGIYGGVLPQEQFNSTHEQADALLVVMDFEPTNRRRVRTSFPSKILDYAAFGKPLVIWGPEECSAARFIRSNNAGCVVNRCNTRDVIHAVESLFSDADLRLRLGQAAAELSRTIFDPQTIHYELKRYIASVLNP